MENKTYKRSDLVPLKKATLSYMAERLNIKTNGMKKDEIIDAIIGQQLPPESKIEESSSIIFTDTLEVEEETEKNISPLSPHWTEYVLSQLHDSEYSDKYPSTDGLRRLFPIFVGDIIERDVHPVECPTEGQARATVKCTLKYVPHGKYGIGKEGLYHTISDASDCFYGNTVAPFNKHPVSTAGTMAEGRCLRKAMYLRVQTLEEMQDLDPAEAQEAQDRQDSVSPASETNKMAIERICKRRGLDLIKFLKYTPGVNADTIESLSQRESVILLRFLSDYNRGVDQGGKSIPPEILVNKMPEPPTVTNSLESGTMTKGE